MHDAPTLHIFAVHRQPLLEQLQTYLVRWPEEKEPVQSFLNFVNRESECFQRSLHCGHITGSAWVVSLDGNKVLLTHHRKLNRWLQLGGHADGEPALMAVAIREAVEESGLWEFEAVEAEIFDLDIHLIPAREHEPEHLHYDVRYVLRAIGSVDFTVSDESHDLRWVTLDEVESLSTDPSMARMVRKWRQRKSRRLPGITIS